MRLNLGLLAVFVLVLGCGHDGGASSPAQRLSGHWTEMEAAKECVYAMSFREDGLIESKEICVLADGTLGMSIDSGQFDATETSFTWTVHESTCAYEAPATETVQYTLNGDQLTLTVPRGVVILKRARQNTSGAGETVTFGCLSDDGGSFEARALLPI